MISISESESIAEEKPSAKTACFIFPEASGHINSSLALSARLAKKGWKIHYLSAMVMKDVIEQTGATFDDERTVAPELCQGGLGYFAAYERLREEKCPGSKAWEGRAHLENHFLLMKLPGTIDWLRQKQPDVVLYCPICNRIAQIASRVLDIPHVAIVTIAGFGGFHKILSSELNQYNLDRSLFGEGSPLYYFGRDPDCAPYGMTLGKHTLVTTIPSLRDPIFDSIDKEDRLYMDKCGSRMHYIGPMLGEPGLSRALTHKAAFTEEEQRLLMEQSECVHRCRSQLHPNKQEDLVGIVKDAKNLGRRVVLVSLGTIVTSDRLAFGWKGTGLGGSITGKELVQSVINGVIDALEPFFDISISSSVKEY
jgi:hypothetical protein